MRHIFRMVSHSSLMKVKQTVIETGRFDGPRMPPHLLQCTSSDCPLACEIGFQIRIKEPVRGDLSCLDADQGRFGHSASFSLFWRSPVMAKIAEISEQTPELQISTETVCFIIAKAREFDAKDEV